jgi:hypothetical protein
LNNTRYQACAHWPASSRGKNAIFDIAIAMRVDVLTLDVFDWGLSAVLDAFQTANGVNRTCELTVSRFDVRVVGVWKTVRTSQGLSVPVQAASLRPADSLG